MEEIDYIIANKAGPKSKYLIYGYIRLEFDDPFLHFTSENPICYTIFAYLYARFDLFSTFFGKYENDDYDISGDYRTLSGCGYNCHSIDPYNKKYNRYQWLIDVRKCYDFVLFGITSFKDTNKPWCCNFDIIQYNFSSFGEFCPYNDPSLDDKYGHLKCENMGFSKYHFTNVYYIILDLNITKKEFKLYVRNTLGGIHKNIKFEKGIKYNLGCFILHRKDYIRIAMFSKFNDNLSSSSCQNLLNFDINELSSTNHPNGEINIDHSKLVLFNPDEYEEEEEKEKIRKNARRYKSYNPYDCKWYNGYWVIKH